MRSARLKRNYRNTRGAVRDNPKTKRCRSSAPLHPTSHFSHISPTEAFTHSCLYTQMPLPTQIAASTQVHLHTKTFAQRQLVHTSVFNTDAFTHRQLLHTGAFDTGALTHRKFLHTGAFTHGCFYTPKHFHRAAFTHGCL